MRISGSSTGIFCWTFIFLFVVFTTNAASTADSLFAKGDYSSAALEYEYEYYRATDNIVRCAALFRKAECYSLSGSHAEASATLDRIDVSGIPDSLIVNVHEKLAFSSYLSGTFEKAENHLLQYEILAVDSAFKLYPLYTLVLNELQRWEEAQAKLKAYVEKKYSGSEKDSLLNSIDRAYAKDNLPELKKLKKAQTMSAFFPGLGQMYAGYYKEGVTSAILVLGSVGFTVYSVITAHYITAAVIGYGLMSKFYQGGIKHLEYLVGKRNYEASKKFNDSVRPFILGIREK